MDLIRVKDAHFTYPPTFRRHRAGEEGDDMLGEVDDLTGTEYDEDDDTPGRGASPASRLVPTVALRGVSMRVKEGEGFALVGRPGSGRSTVLSLMAGLLRPDAGTVAVRGWAGGLPGAGAGFLRWLSVQENIVRNLMLLGETHTRAREMVEDVASWLGLEERLETQLRTLPRPVIRQLGYATALHANPTVFLADDDVATLPKPIRERGLQRLEEYRCEGHALVVATNRREVLQRLCTRGVLLDRGVVVAEGEVDHLLSVLKGVPLSEDGEEETADESSDD